MKNIFVLIILAAVTIHGIMLFSLLSEPKVFEYEVHLTGSKSHPQEKYEIRGFLDAFFHDTDRVPRGLDFFSIYQSGNNFLNGHSIYYGVRKHRLGDQALVVPYFSGFRYLPVYACTFGVLLNIFSPWTSYWVWIFLVELLLFLNLFIISKLPIPKSNKLLLSAMWLSFSPYYIELHIGQQSMVTVTLLHLTILFHLKNYKILRDSSYMGSVLWKINTILFVPIWIKLRRFRMVFMLLILTFLLSAPYFFMVSGSFAEFISYFKHKFIAVGPNSHGFWALAATLFQRGGFDHSQIKLLLTLWTLFILTITSLVTLLPRRINILTALASWICVYFITYQYVWEHHYVMILPVITILFCYSEYRFAGFFLWLFTAIPTPYIFMNDRNLLMPQAEWSILEDIGYHSIKIIPVLLIYILLISSQLFSRPEMTKNNAEHDQLDVFKFLRFRR